CSPVQPPRPGLSGPPHRHQTPRSRCAFVPLPAVRCDTLISCCPFDPERVLVAMSPSWKAS
ncbi:MAG: hypothetical protein AVDCRST_MAG43-43, partial [uncultured Thermomicrobiales bacterium]